MDHCLKNLALHVLGQAMGRRLPVQFTSFAAEPHDCQTISKIDSGEEWCDRLRSLFDRYPSSLQLCLDQCDWSLAQWAAACHQQVVQARRCGGGIVCRDSINYPGLLALEKSAPLVLFFRGNPVALKHRAVALVGARKASQHALCRSYEVAAELSRGEVSVVSGGAFGCDTAAHLGALDQRASGQTIAVLAGGLAEWRPPSQALLLDRLVSNGGCVVSERLWHYEPRRSDFVVRNRLVAGMAEIVVIMQAGLASGAISTANFALSAGREVAVLAHPAHDRRAAGSLRLMNDGAFSFGTTSEFMAWYADQAPLLKIIGG